MSNSNVFVLQTTKCLSIISAGILDYVPKHLYIQLIRSGNDKVIINIYKLKLVVLLLIPPTHPPKNPEGIYINWTSNDVEVHFLIRCETLNSTHYRPPFFFNFRFNEEQFYSGFLNIFEDIVLNDEGEIKDDIARYNTTHFSKSLFYSYAIW